MKKLFSISLMVFMLFAIVHIAVSKHFCGGKVISSNISLSGKHIGCGMENSLMDYPLQGTHLSSHCCDDIVNFYGIDNFYFPSSYSIPACSQLSLHIFNLPSRSDYQIAALSTAHYKGESPPGALLSTIVDISTICVFRI